MSEEVIRTLRQQAWQRAKGELQAVIATYWNEREKFEAFDKLAAEFIENVDNEGLAE